MPSSLWVLLVAALGTTRLVAADSYVATIEYYVGDSSCSGSYYGGAAPSSTLFARLDTQNLTQCQTYVRDYVTSFYSINLSTVPLDTCSYYYLGSIYTSLTPRCSLLPSSVSLESFANQTLGQFPTHLSEKLWHFNNVTSCYLLQGVTSKVTVLESHQYQVLDLCLPVGSYTSSQRIVATADQLSRQSSFWSTNGKCEGNPAYTTQLSDVCDRASSFLTWPVATTPSVTPAPSSTASPSTTATVPTPSTSASVPIPSTSASVPTASTSTSVPTASTNPSEPTASTAPSVPTASTPVSSPAAVDSSGNTLKSFGVFGMMAAACIAFVL